MPGFEIRPYEDADEGAVLALLATSLGKVVDDRYRAFFRWKHLANPAGRSFMWVADTGSAIVGFRSFLRWRFRGPDGASLEAVRAVDTATDPKHRGGGVFRGLTEHGLGELASAGVDFVFNTPNDQSRPGYLKMGWSIVGRAPVQVRPRGLGSLLRLARARTAAGLWSEPTSVGLPAEEVLADPAVPGLLASLSSVAAVTTERTEAHLRWRYDGFAAVASRAVLLGDDVVDGFALVRLRRRGGALECTVGDVVVPPGGSTGGLRRALSASRADYGLAGSRELVRLRGFVATDRLGPVVTFRDPRMPGASPPRFALALGDLELF